MFGNIRSLCAKEPGIEYRVRKKETMATVSASNEASLATYLVINFITSTQLRKVEPEKGAGRSSDDTMGADVDVDEAYACAWSC